VFKTNTKKNTANTSGEKVKHEEGDKSAGGGKGLRARIIRRGTGKKPELKKQKWGMTKKKQRRTGVVCAQARPANSSRGEGNMGSLGQTYETWGGKSDNAVKTAPKRDRSKRE